MQTHALRHDVPGTLYNLPESPNASQGHLSELRDEEAITRYRRDSLGRIVRKAQLHASGEQRHQYDATGQLTTLRRDGPSP
ncbi:MAG: hypothetical protein QM569_07085 [Acidovorax sp.]|uniref:hypothetical protein n=1 Tax=Acidovorax sp. TaxID=1872122 RepID=UPI0039E6E751